MASVTFGAGAGRKRLADWAGASYSMSVYERKYTVVGGSKDDETVMREVSAGCFVRNLRIRSTVGEEIPRHIRRKECGGHLKVTDCALFHSVFDYGAAK